MPGRRKVGKENIRSLTKVSSGKSYAITLPMAMVKTLHWKERQKLELSFDAKKKVITVRDWKK